MLRQPLTPEPQGAGLGALPFAIAYALKVPTARADTLDMIISDEQVRRAVEYLRTSEEHQDDPAATVGEPASTELVSRVRAEVERLPDVREDRIAHARVLMADDLPPAEELASKLIGRIISDSVR